MKVPKWYVEYTRARLTCQIGTSIAVFTAPDVPNWYVMRDHSSGPGTRLVPQADTHNTLPLPRTSPSRGYHRRAVVQTAQTSSHSGGCAVCTCPACPARNLFPRLARPWLPACRLLLSVSRRPILHRCRRQSCTIVGNAAPPIRSSAIVHNAPDRRQSCTTRRPPA